MTREEIKAFVDRFAKAWAAKDIDALLACYDAHAELTSPLLHTQRGIEAIERVHQDLFLAFSDVAVDVHDVVIDTTEQRAVLVMTIQFTQQGEFLGFPASGRRGANQMAFVFRFKGGRIMVERRLYDYGGFLMQLGVLKARSV
jgi:steroid delta-isomerase-like uncharacterized protein